MHFFHLVSEYTRHSTHSVRWGSDRRASFLHLILEYTSLLSVHAIVVGTAILHLILECVFRFCRGALISNTSMDRTIFPQGGGTLSFPHVILHAFCAFFDLHCRYTSGCNRHASCIWREGNCHLQSPACSPCAICMSNFRANSKRARFTTSIHPQTKHQAHDAMFKFLGTCSRWKRTRSCQQM